jgi:hypothetical protein
MEVTGGLAEPLSARTRPTYDSSMASPVVAGVLLCTPAVAAVALGPRSTRCFRWLVARIVLPVLRFLLRPLIAWWRRRRVVPERPLGRPIELIARDAQRLGRRFRSEPPRDSFARSEGARRAYDAVLAEACRTLGVEHLLQVLPPGPDLDIERLRVEAVLDRYGLRLDDAA